MMMILGGVVLVASVFRMDYNEKLGCEEDFENGNKGLGGVGHIGIYTNYGLHTNQTVARVDAVPFFNLDPGEKILLIDEEESEMALKENARPDHASYVLVASR